ncbi:MAG: DNA alkylation repair protein [Halobacteriota archaeon]|nr:DNA alkylation repair protein [Halobacteriota archaeon]
MDNSETILGIRDSLKENVDAKTKATAQNYFKEEIKFYGVKTSIVTKISKESYEKIADLRKDEIFSLCELLLKSGYIEETFIAFKWAEYISGDFEEGDFKVLEMWLKNYVTNWAACDTLCNHAIGNFIEMYPDYVRDLKGWTKSENRWVRRGAAVTLILPARKGLFLKDVLEIASMLIDDRDDLVQKGYGWMLKEASRMHQKDIFNYVMKNKKIMPRTALRYAIEKMPDELRREAMKR